MAQDENKKDAKNVNNKNDASLDKKRATKPLIPGKPDPFKQFKNQNRFSNIPNKKSFESFHRRLGK